MIATTNLPGSKHFSWFHGTKKECEDWLDDQKKKHQDAHGGVWTSTYLPAQIHTDKKAMKWRYRDGTRVFPFHAGKFDNNSQYDYPGNCVYDYPGYCV